MNPLVKFSIANFKELIVELARTNKPEYLFELEDKVIEEIATLASSKKKHKARLEILNIKKQIMKDIKAEPHIKPILKSFRNSIEGAATSALYFL